MYKHCLFVLHSLLKCMFIEGTLEKCKAWDLTKRFLSFISDVQYTEFEMSNVTVVDLFCFVYVLN